MNRYKTKNINLQLFAGENQYTLTNSLTNLSIQNISIQMQPATGYELPSSITVVNGTLVSYDSSTGVAVINGNNNTSITAECQEPAPVGNPYLTFSSPDTFTLNVVDNQKYWDGVLEYSTDTQNWSEWDGTTTLNSSATGNSKNLYLRGTNNTIITGITHSGTPTQAYWQLTGGDISCDGNIENLLDYTEVSLGNHPPMGTKCYGNMFYNCTSLKIAPTLSATTVAGYCYGYMFKNCTGLTTAPDLPATTLGLAQSCYSNMFAGCTGLTIAPTLPATTLVRSCYSMMFADCTGLTTAPALPATTISQSCYQNMFKNCTSLTAAPALPATTLATYCYSNMFSGCTGLVMAPALPATTLATRCYEYMFFGCTGLAMAAALPATTLGTTCYSNMFRNCANLTTLPALPATTLGTTCYSNMFSGCSKIKLSATQTGEYQTAYRIPASGEGTAETDSLSDMFKETGGTFTGTPEINTIYYTSNTIIS